MEEANEFLKEGFWLRFNGSFAVSPKEAKSAFSPLLPSLKAKLPDILCLQAICSRHSWCHLLTLCLALH